MLGADPAATLDALSARAQAADAGMARSVDRGRHGRGRRDRRARSATTWASRAIARELTALLPHDATLFVASSMPVRDVETFMAARADPPRVLAHRGANGIDGTVSAAFGAAAAGDGPVALLIGDVALAHDLGGLLAATRLGIALTIVLVDNGGGGIFEFLPVAGATDAFEEHVATPTGLDPERIAALFGLAYSAPADTAAFAAAVTAALASDGTTLVHVRTDRKDNVAEHRAVWEAVRNRA